MRGIHQLKLGLLATGAAVLVTAATAGAATATFERRRPITIPLGHAAVAPYPSTISVEDSRRQSRTST